MNARRHRALLGATLALMLIFSALLPGGVTAQGTITTGGGIGIYPVQIELTDALRGAEYLRTITVINREQTDFRLGFVPDGEIGPWLSIHESIDQEAPLSEVIVTANSDARFILRVAIPADVANGSYTGGIRFQGGASAEDESDSGMGVSIGIAADVIVHVNGTQNLSGAVLDLWVDDAEVEQPPVRLRMQFQNDGNVQATPVIEWQITNAAGAVVDDIRYDETVVQPGLIESIVAEWDPSGHPAGDYTASVAVRLGDTTIHEQKLEFQLLPVGTLTRAGVLDRLVLEGEPQPESIAKVVGYFQNTGQIDTRAIFAVEVYRDAQLVEIVESLERLTVVGELALIEAFFEVPEAGDYQVRGKVVYEGKETEVKDLAFSVSPLAAIPEAAQTSVSPAPVQVASDQGQPLHIWILAIATVLAVVGGFVFLTGRGRRPSGVMRRSSTGDRRRTRSSEP